MLMKPEPDELELALRARNGDREALAELIERLRFGLFALAYAELRHYEDAQDAVAAAIFHICRHVVDLRNPDAMRAWMHAIVRNETHRLRRGQPMRSISLDEAYSVGTEDPSPLLRLDVERALQQLPNDQARAVGLFYLSRWPIATIASHLARPEGTIKRWLHRGRQHLATQMRGYFPMEQVWKACIVAPEITTVQLQCVTEALTASGWNDVQTVTNIKSFDDLYHLDEMSSRQEAFTNSEAVGGYVAEVMQKLTDPLATPLVEPLASSQLLVLGERVAGRSALEFILILRTLARAMPVCLLIERPYTDSSVYASWIAGCNLCITSDSDGPFFQHWFTELRKGIGTGETTE